jgi:hypothetical protein
MACYDTRVSLCATEMTRALECHCAQRNNLSIVMKLKSLCRMLREVEKRVSDPTRRPAVEAS